MNTMPVIKRIMLMLMPPEPWSWGSNSVAQSEMHVILLPGRARLLSANPILSWSTSNMPTKAVKKALPRIIEFELWLPSKAIWV